MNNVIETDYFDFILKVTDHVDYNLHSALHMSPEYDLGDEWLKEQMLKFKGTYHQKNSVYGNLCLESHKLDTEIRSRFMSHSDSRLQDRYANYLMAKVEQSLLPLFYTVTSTTEEFSQYPYENGHPFETAGYIFFAMMKKELYSWIYVIIENVKIFAPERFAASSHNIRLPEYDEFGDEITFEHISDTLEQTEPAAKLPLKNLPPKILLLYELGFFNLPKVQELGFEAKGKLISALCGGSADNAVDYIRECDPDRPALTKNPYGKPANKRAVDDFLRSLR